MGDYQENLRHIAEPGSPSEREEADKIVLEDYQALWFAGQLREYAHYGESKDRGRIAAGAAEYIDKKVREQECSQVSLYAHTKKAMETYDKALTHAVSEYNSPDVPRQIAAEIIELK